MATTTMDAASAAQTQERINPVGIGIAILGALTGIVAVFLQMVSPPNAIPIRDNAIVQAQPGIAARYVILAVIILVLTYASHQRGRVSIGVLIASALLMIGAVVDAKHHGYYELSYSS